MPPKPQRSARGEESDKEQKGSSKKTAIQKTPDVNSFSPLGDTDRLNIGQPSLMDDGLGLSQEPAGSSFNASGSAGAEKTQRSTGEKYRNPQNNSGEHRSFPPGVKEKAKAPARAVTLVRKNNLGHWDQSAL